MIVSTQFNELITWKYLLLYIACIFWTLAYDTIYAYQDRDDDIDSGIKSTAVLFNKKGKLFIILFYTVFMGLIGYIGFINSFSIYSIICIIIPYIFTLILINKWNINSKSESNIFFKRNNIIGLICFVYLFVF